MQQKQLVRSLNNRNIAGVCAGIAVYFNTNPTNVRFLFLVVATATAVFPVALVYLVLVLVLPEGQTASYDSTKGSRPLQGQPQVYQQPQPSTYQGSNELDNMATPVSDVPKPSPREYALQPPKDSRLG